MPPSQNSLAVEGRCLSRSSSICHSQEFCGSCFLAEDARIYSSDYTFWGLGMGYSYPQICRAYFKRNIQWDLYNMQLNLNAYLGRKMLRKHRTKCNNCCTPVIQTSELVRSWSIFVILPQFPNNWFAVFQSDSRPVLQHFLKHLLQGR